MLSRRSHRTGRYSYFLHQPANVLRRLTRDSAHTKGNNKVNRGANTTEGIRLNTKKPVLTKAR